MNKKLELNKYDKKTLELQKKVSSFKTEQKKITGLFGEGYVLIIHLFFLHMKKIGTNFAYFDNTAKSKAKVQQ